VGDDFGDGFLGGGGCGGLAGEVEAGDLEAVEEEAGAAGVEVVGGDAAEDLANGGLDGAAVFGQGQVEGGLTGAALAGVERGAAGGVVVVAELFVMIISVAEAWAAAAVSVGEDVAALEAFGGVGHWQAPSRAFWCKVFKRKGLTPDLPV
jgi:hypothetical protein